MKPLQPGPRDPSEPQRMSYSTTAIALHWVLGLAVLGIFLMGLYMTGLPFSPQRLKLFNWHKWAGVTFLLLSTVRLCWRITHRPPNLPTAVSTAMPPWQTWLYHGTHHGLYLLFFAVPLMGWAYSSAAGFPIVWFGQIALPDLLAADKALAEILKPLHRVLAYALLGLASLHIAAALKHHWIDRDGLLTRMLPTRA